ACGRRRRRWHRRTLLPARAPAPPALRPAGPTRGAAKHRKHHHSWEHIEIKRDRSETRGLFSVFAPPSPAGQGDYTHSERRIKAIAVGQREALVRFSGRCTAATNPKRQRVTAPR